MNGTDKPLSVEDLAGELAQPMKRYLARYVGDQGVAEDLWQETLIRMHKGLSAFEGRSSAKTWAFSIATRVAADYVRRPEHNASVVELTAVAEPVDSDRAIDEQMVIDEMNRCVRGVIDSLPDDYRSALILHDLEGLTAKQVAEVCDCSVASAKIRIHRARLRLKDALKEECAFYHDADSVLRCESKSRAPRSPDSLAGQGARPLTPAPVLSTEKDAQVPPRLEVFDPAMCCSTGVCGPTVDPELARFAADIAWLSRRGVDVARHNLAQEPAAFAENATVLASLNATGPACLPLVFIDGEPVPGVGYPQRQPLMELLGVDGDD